MNEKTPAAPSVPPRFRLRLLPALRTLAQVGTALAFIAIPLLNLHEYNVVSGNLLAFNAGAFRLGDPLAALQVLGGALSATLPMLAGAGVVLLLACVLGPVFCSWLCPYGLLSELVHRKKPEAQGSTRDLTPANLRPFLVKTGILLGGLAVVLVARSGPLLNQLSMPGWYTRLLQHGVLYREILWGALAFMGVFLLLEAVSGRRIWCTFLCPQSVLLSLAGLLFPRRLHVQCTRRACTCPPGDRACRKACSLGLDPRAYTLAQRLRCTNCGDCVAACSDRGKALRLGFGKQGG